MTKEISNCRSIAQARQSNLETVSFDDFTPYLEDDGDMFIESEVGETNEGKN